MRYIETFREGMHVSDVYLCTNKQIQLGRGRMVRLGGEDTAGVPDRIDIDYTW